MPASTKTAETSLLWIHVKNGNKDGKDGINPASRAALRSHVMKVHRGRHRGRETACSNRPNSAMKAPIEQQVACISKPRSTLEQSQIAVKGTVLEASTSLPDQRRWELDIRPLLPQSPSHTSIDRTGFTAVWLVNFLPTEYLTSSKPLSTLQLWTTIDSPSHQVANDTVGWLNLGSIFNDSALLLEGRRHQVMTTTALRREISRERYNVHAVFTAAIDLILCEIWRAHHTDAESLNAYISGMIAVASASQLSAPFYARLFEHYRHISVFHSLVSRTKMPRGRSFWKRPGIASPGSVDSLMELAVSIPDLAVKSDHVRASASFGAISDTKSHIAALIRRFDSWREDYQMYEAATVSRPDTAHPEDELRFSDVLDGAVLSCYWCFQLALQHALASLEGDCTGASSIGTSDITAGNYYASLLVRAIPHLREMAGAAVSQAATVRAPLFFAIRWYELINNTIALQKCQTIEAEVRSKLHYIDWDALLPFSFLFIILWAPG
ncbi:hypothetical protein BDZ85DRAFT_43765 [Elsinoe ampelina]|uniref:Fungal-specific transcription factor domain-containing protein n=1 Tax=Elsinoe ampelina TaxID=302913 RepID=A0A6A6G1U4_9PEZI|nr:hypothetical protein BDZ85DRAFT_43765 [Elsinoe ampelina]